MPIKLNSTGGGSVSIDVPSTASTYTLTAPARTGTIITSADSNTVTQTMVQTGFAGNGPSFSAYNSVAIAINYATWTKIAMQTEEWDTANCFDSTTNYRFTPNVAGYYQLSGSLQVTNNIIMALSIYKNGNEYRRGLYSNPATIFCGSISSMVYLNGTTDYVELYGYSATAGSVNTQTGTYTHFSGFLARAA